MHLRTVNGHSRLLFWSHVREFAVPTSMIESSTARRVAGDWAGACAAARVDVDLDLRTVSRFHGDDLAHAVRADLRHLVPDLLRWHFPRIRPDGLLRPGITVSLARYLSGVHLVARTPPAWADAGQRISLALWQPSGVPKPDRRFRLDLHRHLWDARRTSELRERSGTGDDHGRATHRWRAEAALLLHAEGRAGSKVAVRLSSRHRIVLDLTGRACTPTNTALPILPDAATWALPDLKLVHAGLIDADRLHPLVRSALLPDRPTGAMRSPDGTTGPRLVDCRGATHRIGVVDGVLVALDHGPDDLRREALLVALGGTGLPCLQAIDAVHRQPDDLADVRARLDHGDVAGALAVVEDLLGPDAVLLDGPLRDELETAARRKVTHGLYRAGLTGHGPIASTQDPRRGDRPRRRHNTLQGDRT